MFASLIAFIKSFFTKHEVDAIIADIEAKVNSLNVAAEFHAAEADLHSAAAAIKTQLSTAANAESTRAKVIAAKLAGLIS